jgi:hypothetical protein
MDSSRLDARLSRLAADLVYTIGAAMEQGMVGGNDKDVAKEMENMSDLHEGSRTGALDRFQLAAKAESSTVSGSSRNSLI